MSDLIVKRWLAVRVALEANMDGVKLVVAVDQRPVRTTPDDIGRELLVQDVGVTLIMASLKPCGKSFDRCFSVRADDSNLGTVCHGRTSLAHHVFDFMNIRRTPPERLIDPSRAVVGCLQF